MLIDTHAHLDEQAFSADVEEVVQHARDAGLKAIVTIGTTAASSCEAVRLAERFPEVFAAVGIHPNYASQAVATDWERIDELAQHPRVVAIGETGLDRYWDHTPFDVQVDAFQRQIELSARIGKPFIIHCREAEAEVLQMLRQAAGNGQPVHAVMHSFAGTAATAQECLKLGLHLSFSGMITFKKNEGLRQIAAAAPADRLFVETDAPYLSPAPHRDKRNEPAFVRFTAEKLAATRGVSVSEISEF